MLKAKNDDIFAPLRGEGVRAWRRLTPSREHPATASIKGLKGRVKSRPILDISMGGIAVGLKSWDQRKLQVGEVVHVELDLSGLLLTLQARVVHIQIRNSWLRKQVITGLVFDKNLSLRQSRPRMARYMMRLVRAENAAQD